MIMKQTFKQFYAKKNCKYYRSIISEEEAIVRYA